MRRPAYKYLVAAILVLLAVSPLRAFYDGDNQPDGQPPNYTPLDSSYFMGAPKFANYSTRTLGGYYVYLDTVTDRWNVVGLVWPGGTLYEQVHGSALVQLDEEPQEGVNVWPIGFTRTDDLRKNDRWGWVKWPETIGPNLYEIWWDYTIDVARLSTTTDWLDTVGISFSGCSIDFNIWASGHFASFTPEQIKVGRSMMPITMVPGYEDAIAGHADPYQGDTPPKSPNTTNFTMKDLPGAAFGPDGRISAEDTYGGARAYEGNGIEFSVSACPPPGNNPPVFLPPMGTTAERTLCLGESITDTVWATDPDAGDVLTMEILSGPGALTSTPGPSPLAGYFTWTPTEAGTYTVVYKVTDAHDLFAVDSLTYVITLNHPPTAAAADTTIALCWIGEPICRTLTAVDAENDPLTFTLLDGEGSLDPTTGELCFTPEKAGEYGFLVAVADVCGADTVSFVTTITANNPPQINPYDSVIVSCATDTVCFDVTASDPDAGDSLVIIPLSGPGRFVQTGNGLGRQCFLPDDVDSARYVFTYAVTDDCMRGEAVDKIVPPPPTDSIIIIVITDRPPTIVCPEVQEKLLCAPEMVCYTFGTVDQSDVTYTLLSGTGTIDPVTGELCFYAETSGRYTFKVAAANVCGADTCLATFDVTVDSPPSVSLADSAVQLCRVEEICLPLTFSDPDDDIVSITVQSEKYIVTDGMVCFTPDGPGVHTIIVTVADSCGNTAVDTARVDVRLNAAPLATAPADTVVLLCAPAEICLSGFAADDPDGNLASTTILPNIGRLTDGTYCFTPDTAGTYCLTIQAVDSCGATDADTVCVTVERDAAPVLNCPPEPIVTALCTADTVCVPIGVEPSGSAIAVTTPGAWYDDGRVCFYAAESGEYRFTVTTANDCGADTCEIVVQATVGIPPILTCAPDSAVHLCGPDSISIPVTVSPAEAAITVSPDGGYADGMVTLYAGAEGRYCLTVIAVTECGADTCGTCIDVTFDRAPQVTMADTAVALCATREICLPVSITDPDDNLTETTVLPEGASLADGKVCFTPEEAGRYDIIVTAVDACGNRAADTARVDVALNTPPTVTVPDTAVFICEPMEVCLPVTSGDADGNIVSIAAEPPAAYDADGQVVCLTVSASGQYPVRVTVIDDCGDTVTATATIAVTANVPPTVIVPEDTSVAQCAPAEICLSGITGTDPEDGTLAVTVTPDVGQLTNDIFCFTPDTAGVYRFVFTATDICGAVDADTVLVTVERGTVAVISCPEPQPAALCQPDSICIPVTVSPAEAVVTILEPGAEYRDGKVCFFAAEDGAYRFTVVAAGECGADTCTVEADVTVGIPPIVTCPETQDVHLCAPGTITIPVTVSPSGAVVRVLPDGTYENGLVTFAVETAGTVCRTIIAETDCGADTCQVCVNATFDLPPTVSLPDSTLVLCEPAEICIPMTFSDPDDNIASITIEQPNYKLAEGYVCFNADASGVYRFVVTVTDSCGLSDVDTAVVTVTLNTPPTVAVPDTAVFICGPTEVCLPVTAGDVDGAVDSVVVTPPAFYDDATQSVCMIVSKSGTYDLMVIVYDDCGSSASDIATITAALNHAPEVTVPGDTAVFQCLAEEICLDGFAASDVDGNLVGLSVTPALGEFVGDRYCFTPTVAGTYVLAVTATDSCGETAADTVRVTVTWNQPPTVAIDDTTAFVCQPTEICLPVTFSDPDGTVDSVAVTPIGYYDENKQMICVPVPSAGAYTITVTVFDDCGASAADGALLTVTVNRPPVLNDLPPVSMTLCELTTVCADVDVSDPDDNLTEVRATSTCGGPVIYDPLTHKLCWTPDAFGACSLTVIASDGCGAADTALMTVELTPGTLPDPVCPNDTTVRICGVGEVCLSVGPLGHDVTIHPTYFDYDPATGILCYNVEGSRTDTVWVLDATDCGVDSCRFIVRTVVNQGPKVTGESVADGRFCEPFELCIPVTISDPENNIASIVADGCAGATYDPATRKVCLPVDDDIDCTVRVTATDSCGLTASWSTRVVMRRNNPPVVSVPELKTIVRCDSDTTPVVVAEFCVTDPDYDAVQMVLDSGLGTFTFNSITNCGFLTFTPPTNDSARYCFRLRATDICDTVYADYCLTIMPTAVCSTCVSVSIVGPGCVSVGATATMNLTVETDNSIAGFDLLMSYDASALNFLRADVGPAISGWEYFTFRYGAQGNCEGSCPSGMLRIVAIADVNNGPAHPPAEQLDPQGIIGSMTFRVVNNANLGGQSIPVGFFWYDCGDNTFSDPTGEYLLLDQSIYSAEGNIVWDESNDDAFPESARPDFWGAADTCLEGGSKTVPVRCVSFHNGALCIVHPDSIDARGDMNLNGVAYEIADAVVYTNYFIIGLKAFSVSIPGQVAASDINGDGLTLTVADLVYLIRVITGDAAPYAKEVVGGGTAALACVSSGTATTVTVEASEAVGAAALVFRCDGERPGDPVLGSAAAQMEMKYAWADDGTLRVLIYSFDAGKAIDAVGELVTIPSSGDALVTLEEVDLADYYGRTMTPNATNTVLPRLMELTQNRPNPFNPSTTFELALPVASEYTVEIYNITGQVIRSWSGSAPAGYVTFEWNGEDAGGRRVASGIYFYRAHAAGETAIRKMIMLK